MRRYVFWMIGFLLAAIALTIFVTYHNGTDDDLLFIIETLGIGFCVNVVASIVIVVFIDRRDKRMRFLRERSAAHRVALEIARYLRVEPRPDITILRDKLEYLLDTLHFELNPTIKHDINIFLDHTDGLKHGSEPNKTILAEIETISASLQKHYGPEIFSTTRRPVAQQ